MSIPVGIRPHQTDSRRTEYHAGAAAQGTQQKHGGYPAFVQHLAGQKIAGDAAKATEYNNAAEAFAGTWEDLLTGESGTVGAGEPRNPGPGAATAPGTPGFGCAAAIVALAAAYRWRCGR